MSTWICRQDTAASIARPRLRPNYEERVTYPSYSNRLILILYTSLSLIVDSTGNI
jgi:hypothetical protein